MDPSEAHCTWGALTMLRSLGKEGLKDLADFPTPRNQSAKKPQGIARMCKNTLLAREC